MSVFVGEEIQYKVDVDGDLIDAFKDVLDRQGTNQKVGVARLLRWFVVQNPSIQAMVLGQLPEDAQMVVARELLQGFIDTGEIGIIPRESREEREQAKPGQSRNRRSG